MQCAHCARYMNIFRYNLVDVCCKWCISLCVYKVCNRIKLRNAVASMSLLLILFRLFVERWTNSVKIAESHFRDTSNHGNIKLCCVFLEFPFAFVTRFSISVNRIKYRTVRSAQNLTRKWAESTQTHLKNDDERCYFI